MEGPIEYQMIKIPAVISAAIDVIRNVYGVGSARKEALRCAGYDPDEVQQCVNDICALMSKYGGD